MSVGLEQWECCCFEVDCFLIANERYHRLRWTCSSMFRPGSLLGLGQRLGRMCGGWGNRRRLLGGWLRRRSRRKLDHRPRSLDLKLGSVVGVGICFGLTIYFTEGGDEKSETNNGGNNCSKRRTVLFLCRRPQNPRNTYADPIVKVMRSPIFFFRDICKLTTIGIGMKMIITSTITAIAAVALNSATRFMQVPSTPATNVKSQPKRIGEQAKIADQKIPKFEPILTNMVNHTEYLNHGLWFPRFE